ncbi:arsenic transporter [Campylobacter upsaliensis]|uniref:ArsB/NhaD family transporter n=1 Tax=Campylobacter upsaliensis TaxID=28080 RepID=UPI00127BF0C8|nr:ArsB/NhaD family transporter [Campylobacter upsaliensis]EAI0016257.1 arsenic transporter [Campylobacter upsaliensis]EAK2872182.1 arsenic transporter [Campylobacter upsaliensis]ECC1871073.1 arsenic transporter [Campylobacter upsaliensis]ECH3658399.1 arsenic transporter [Campylobacter upsaliensis]ECK6872514.1 arsenic transporter [Campylobacter upsaliensis]
MGFIIFILTLLCIYIRPLNLPLWVYSSLGAAFCVGFGFVSLSDVAFVWGMVWDSTLSLVGLIIFALSLEKLGFFEVLAHYTLRLSTHRQTLHLQTWKFFVFIGVLASVLATFFSNDGAILILTPLIIALLTHIENVKFSRSPLIIFLLFVGFMSDFASNTFIFSNLTNIITADFFTIIFIDFALAMALPQLFVILAILVLFWILFTRKLPKTLEFKVHTQALPKPSITLFCFALILLLLFGIIGGENIALCVFTLGVAFLSTLCGILTHKIALTQMLKLAPLGIVTFSLGLFIVVFGLNNMGLVGLLTEGLRHFDTLPLFAQIFSVGISSSLGSSVINNLPMVMLGDLALKDSSNALIFAHLLGCNVGAKLTPIGSLATLLWLFSLKRYGISISFLQYMLVALLIVPFVLFFGLLGLWVYVII